MKSEFSIDKLHDMGFTMADLIRVTGCSYRTLIRLDRGDPKIQAATRARIRRGVEYLRTQQPVNVRKALRAVPG